MKTGTALTLRDSPGESQTAGAPTDSLILVKAVLFGLVSYFKGRMERVFELEC